MSRVVVTAIADSDTADIISYLDVEAGRRVAARYIAGFEKIYARLAIYPRSGSPRPLLGQNVRVSIVLPFVIIHEYVEIDDVVVVLRVLHGRQKISVRSLISEK